MKISRIKHVLITSIIFLIIIAVIVGVYSSLLDAMRKNTEEMVYRVVAKRDIEPGETITSNNVERVQIQDVINAEGMIYRLNKSDVVRESVEESKTLTKGSSAPTDDLWAVGKVANNKIYKGEALLSKELSLKTNVVPVETRLYSIPFDSETTGGYNISLGEDVDICVLYNSDAREISEYQKLPDNKVIDIVLAEKKISDIRDESGNSAIGQAGGAVVPGYVCFNLTYEEINKLELAKRQGTLFIGKPGSYYKEGSQSATFMVDATMPNFN